MCGLVAMVSLLSGCPGKLDDPERFGSTGNSGCEAVVFARSCATSECHDSITAAEGLDLETAGFAARVIGVPARGSEGGVLVEAGAPESSILYRKLTAAPPYGGRMPLALTPLEEADMQCVHDWILAMNPAEPGAPTDE